MSASHGDPHRPNLPIRGAGKRDEAHSRWPLPLSLVLAILLWISLNDSVHEEESISCKVVVQDMASSQGLGVPGQLLVRLPESRVNYTKSQILDGNFKLLNRKVRIDFAGPGRFVSDLDRRLKVWVEVQIPEDGRDEFVCKITKSDLRTAPSDLGPFLVKMDPPEINIKFVASGQYRPQLHPRQVQIDYPAPEDDWNKRIFRETMTFEPKSVTLTGPAKLLEQLKHSKTPIFRVDCRKAPEMLKSDNFEADSNPQNPILGFDLVLSQRFSELTMAQEVKVLIPVKEEPPRFPQGGDNASYTIPVHADWYASPLDPKIFEVSKTLRIQILSYNQELSELLKKDGENWVKRNIRASVDLGEIEGDYQNTEAFFKRLSPHFSNYDDSRFKIGKDFIIKDLNIAQVKRR